MFFIHYALKLKYPLWLTKVQFQFNSCMIKTFTMETRNFQSEVHLSVTIILGHQNLSQLFHMDCPSKKPNSLIWLKHHSLV